MSDASEEDSRKIRGILISGTRKGCGKTFVLELLCCAWKAQGLSLRAFKAGTHGTEGRRLELACGDDCVYLDEWTMGTERCLQLFRRCSKGKDMVLVEGTRGLFDGRNGVGEEGSTARLAKCLQIPVVLVVDCGESVGSAVATVHGFSDFDSELRLSGVIFNKLVDETQLHWLVNAMESQGITVPVLGGVLCLDSTDPSGMERGKSLPLEYIPSLTLSGRTASLASQYLDSDRLLQIGEDCCLHSAQNPIHTDHTSMTERVSQGDDGPLSVTRIQIGVARDDAFCFQDYDNLDLLHKAGAELVYFSPLKDELPSDIQGLYFGDGCPELYGKQLASNRALLDAIWHFSEMGGVVYGERGGLMYLSSEMRCSGNSCFNMCGIFPFSVEADKEMRADSIELEILPGCPLFPAGGTVRGHMLNMNKFTEIEPCDLREGKSTQAQAYHLFYERGTESAKAHISREGYCRNYTLGSCIHLCFSSNVSLASSFVEACKQVPIEIADKAIKAASCIRQAEINRKENVSSREKMEDACNLNGHTCKEHNNHVLIPHMNGTTDKEQSPMKMEHKKYCMDPTSSEVDIARPLSPDVGSRERTPGLRSRASMPNLVNAVDIEKQYKSSPHRSRSENKIFDDTYLFLDYEVGGRQFEEVSMETESLEGKELDRYRPIPRQKTIVSLFSSATETLYALGLGHRIIGVSDSCEYPPHARVQKFVVSKQFFPGTEVALGGNVAWTLSPCTARKYQIDSKWMQAFRPGLIIIDSSCGRFAEAQCSRYGKLAKIARPRTLGDVLDRMLDIAYAVEAFTEGQALVSSLRHRLRATARDIAVQHPKRPRVVTLVSLSPLHVGGHWLPEMEILAGGRSDLQNPGDFVERIAWEEIKCFSPEVLVLAPCCDSQEQILAALSELALQPGWWNLPAVKQGRVYIVDPFLFTKAGPRLVEGVEVLGKILHPDLSNKVISEGTCLKLALEGGKRCRPQHLRDHFKPYTA